MRHAFRKLLIISAAASLCLLAACGKKESETASESNNIAEEHAQSNTSGTSSATTTPIPMEMGETSTSSGVKVTPKFQKYKVTQGANIRGDCDGNSEWKGSLYGGEVVQGTGVCENGWIQIQYNGEKCYVTGSCLEETQEGDPLTGTGTPAPAVTESPSATLTPSATEIPQVTVSPESKVDVSDWAKYSSTKWNSSSSTSCFLQIHSVAGNTVIFRFQVMDGELEDGEKADGLTAEVTNCTGKIVNGVLNFDFTDDAGNVGVGSIEIVDETHLHIATVITQPNPEAPYRAEIMTELTKIQS